MSQVAVRRGSITTILVPRACLRGGEALVQHRMAPGGVAADQHDQIGLLDVLVNAGNDILAEGADVPGDRRRHAQPRIGVDIGGADEALHQLVGDVVILGQELAGDVERDRIRPVLVDRARESMPATRSSASSQPALTPPISGYSRRPCIVERLGERRALRAQPPAIGGMLRVAGDRAVRRRRSARSRRRNRGRSCGHRPPRSCRLPARRVFCLAGRQRSRMRSPSQPHRHGAGAALVGRLGLGRCPAR